MKTKAFENKQIATERHFRDWMSFLKLKPAVWRKAKKTGPWNGHSSMIFPGWEPEEISKNGNNTICLA